MGNVLKLLMCLIIILLIIRWCIWDNSESKKKEKEFEEMCRKYKEKLLKEAYKKEIENEIIK